MNWLWLIVGLLLGVGGVYLWEKKGSEMEVLDWVFLGLWAGLVLFSIALTVGMFNEPYLNAGRAAGISALIFGGLSLISGVLLFRRIFSTS
jgi:hypothetical protein